MLFGCWYGSAAGRKFDGEAFVVASGRRDSCSRSCDDCSLEEGAVGILKDLPHAGIVYRIVCTLLKDFSYHTILCPSHPGSRRTPLSHPSLHAQLTSSSDRHHSKLSCFPFRTPHSFPAAAHSPPYLSAQQDLMEVATRGGGIS